MLGAPVLNGDSTISVVMPGVVISIDVGHRQ
jgi:hypothetical protein